MQYSMYTLSKYLSGSAPTFEDLPSKTSVSTSISKLPSHRLFRPFYDRS